MTQAGLTALIELAAQLCEAPGALLWLHDTSGPRLVARAGIADAEISERLALAVAHVHAEAPAAADGLSGAPVRASDGQVIGGLCVIGPSLRTSTSPLPGLAHQAATLLALDRRLAAHQLREQAARADEAHLRYGLQEEALVAQAAALAELSTPLIPISSDTVVLPLIGSVDAARVDRVLETLLAGITTSRAKVAIVDVTGVTRIDAAAAASLGQVAMAARLLGAAVVLTGIGPTTARALVEIDVDLSGVVLRGTLESGIDYALREAGGLQVTSHDGKERPGERTKP